MNALPATLGPPRAVGAPPFADVVAEHLDAVYRYLVYLTGDRNAAEVLTAETFEKAFRTWRRQDRRRKRATHLALPDRPLRRRRLVPRRGAPPAARGDVRAGPRSSLEETVFAEGLSPELELALRRLTPAEREVVALRVLLELDGPSAARVLGISQTACSTRLSRALKRLEEEMGHARD